MLVPPGTFTRAQSLLVSALLRRCYCFHHTIEIEAAWFLPRRKLAEALQPPANKGSRRSKREHMLDEPAAVIHGNLLGEFERIHSQVCNDRSAQLFEGTDPDMQTMGVLFQKRDLPVAVSQGGN